MTTDSTTGNPFGESGAVGTSTATAHETDSFAHPLRRVHEGSMLGGVATGLARYFDVDVAIARIVIVVLSLVGGAGVPLYLAAWLLIPEEGTDRSVLADLLHYTPAR